MATKYFHMGGMLHTYDSLLHAQLYRVAHDLPTDYFRVKFTNQEKGSLGCVLIHRVLGVPLSGRPKHRAQLNADRPPRMYNTPEHAFVAVSVIGQWRHSEFNVKFVHEVKY